MIKKGFILMLLVVSTHSFGQEWRDSLSVARQAYKKGDYGKALSYYKSAQKKALKEVDLSDEMGQSAYKMREFEQAEKLFRQSKSAKEKSKKAKSYHNIGNTKMQQKDYQGAVNAYKEAMKANPNDEETRYNLSEAIRRLKDQQQKEKQNNQSCKNPNQSQNQKDKNKQPNNQKKQNSKEKQSSNGSEEKSKLPNKTVERMLDQLMRQEAETKRKASFRRGKDNVTTSGKDW